MRLVQTADAMHREITVEITVEVGSIVIVIVATNGRRVGVGAFSLPDSPSPANHHRPALFPDATCEDIIATT